MNVPLFQAIPVLCLGIGSIILMTVKFRIHAFFALMIACFLVGFGLEMPGETIITHMKEGFGNIMKSLGFIIVLGTALGVVLEHTGSSRVMAGFILRLAGERFAALGIGITGYVVGLPVFCDSGFIVLSGLIEPLSKTAAIPVIVLSVSMATGLLSVHCLIPPHPGAAAAAAGLGVDFGKLMLTGAIIAIPAMLAGYGWARYAARRIPFIKPGEKTEAQRESSVSPTVFRSFLPVWTPILLIALKSILVTGSSMHSWLVVLVGFLGDPVIALIIGILLAYLNGHTRDRKNIQTLLQVAVERAGSILVIIGAGGAFGAVLGATHLDQYFSQASTLEKMGILFPFLLTAVLKTAQGSSTVAIITASSIILPLLPSLGLSTDNGKLLCVLSMGAGSMMISHANDAYFWVIARFSGLEMKPMLKVYSLATLMMGLVSFSMVYLLSLILH